MAVLGLTERNLIVILCLPQRVAMRLNDFLNELKCQLRGSLTTHTIPLLPVLLRLALKLLRVVHLSHLMRLLIGLIG